MNTKILFQNGCRYDTLTKMWLVVYCKICKKQNKRIAIKSGKCYYCKIEGNIMTNDSFIRKKMQSFFYKGERYKITKLKNTKLFIKELTNELLFYKFKLIPLKIKKNWCEIGVQRINKRNNLLNFDSFYHSGYFTGITFSVDSVSYDEYELNPSDMGFLNEAIIRVCNRNQLGGNYILDNMNILPNRIRSTEDILNYLYKEN